MKTKTFKTGDVWVMRITFSGAEIDRAMVQHASRLGPGIARAATVENTRPLFETADKTYELRLPVDESPADDPPPAATG